MDIYAYCDSKGIHNEEDCCKQQCIPIHIKTAACIAHIKKAYSWDSLELMFAMSERQFGFLKKIFLPALTTFTRPTGPNGNLRLIRPGMYQDAAATRLSPVSCATLQTVNFQGASVVCTPY